ncbi:MAG: heavy metal-associated domain-containing protein [Methylotenera sp.]|uniref:heavy-metal-associated domain-containing protein n=1 Tax=Methylotenera sp. TaxID=2051956 RepID=UPI0024891966|nr:heavy metal-associated domain-containing protein [Methylotenera sp.]MDI1309051.1 heavy metal-associated domain-containing protein [Methylotenera sp.]
MKKLLLTSLILSTLLSNVAYATQTIKANVNGMVCAFCAQGIERKMRALSQTKDVYVNLKQRVVAVELKDGQTLSNDTVKDLIKDAGYEVTSIEVSEHPITQIKAGYEPIEKEKK